MLPYDRCPHDIVKSVQQRWLLACWSRARGVAPLALSSEFDLDKIADCRDDLSIIDVGPEDGFHRFRIFDHGKNVGAMFAGQCAGKPLVETLPEAARERTLETYEHAVRSRMPVYTVSRVTDAGELPVLYERLLLPLGDSQGRVVRILALLETISTEGMIDRQGLMTGPQPGNRYVVKAELHTPDVAVAV
jgi:hypothetical protein